MSISTTAMLVSLNISQWTARKYDKKISKDVSDQYSTKLEVGKYYKDLLPDQALDKIAAIVTAARAYHTSHTAPWGRDGVQILTNKLFTDYAQSMNKFEAEFWDAVNDFHGVYPQLIMDARNKLNGMFNPADYPDPQVIRSKFAFKVTFDPVPEAGDFRVSISQDEADMIRAQIEERSQTAVKDAMQAVWARLLKATEHMAQKCKDKLRDEKTRLYYSMVDNLKELVEILPALNITNDPDLDRMVQKVRDELLDADVDRLKEDFQAVEELGNKSDAIANAMRQFMFDE